MSMEDPFQNSQPKAATQAPKPAWLKLALVIVLVGVFILVGVFGAYQLWYLPRTSDQLVKYLPVDTILYASAKNPVWPDKGPEIFELPFEKYFTKLESDIVFENIDLSSLLKNSEQAAVAIVLNKDFQLDWLYLFKLKDPDLTQSQLAQLPAQKFFDKDVLVVTFKPESLEVIEQVVNQSTFSLISQRPVKNFNTDLAQVYINSGNLRTFLDQRPGQINKFFSKLASRDVQIYLKSKDGVIYFDHNLNQLPSSQGSTVITTTLPEGYNFFISGVDLASLFKNLESSDQKISDSIKQTTDTIKSIYEFDFSTDLTSLISKSGDLIVIKPQTENFLGFDYLMLFPDVTIDQLLSLEESFRILLSQKLPVEVRRFLSDGSSVIELIANIDQWRWEKTELPNGQKVSILTEPKLSLDLGYTIVNGNLVLASPSALLEDYLNSSNAGPVELASQCGADFSLNYVIIFSKTVQFFGLEDYLPTGNTVFGLKSGCIVKI